MITMIRIALLLLLVMCGVAQAQSVPVICQPHDVIVTKLEKEYGEVQVAIGSAGSSLFEIYASAEGSFTVLLTRPDMNGISCIQGAGTDFSLTGKPLAKKGEPS